VLDFLFAAFGIGDLNAAPLDQDIRKCIRGLTVNKQRKNLRALPHRAKHSTI